MKLTRAAIFAHASSGAVVWWEWRLDETWPIGFSTLVCWVGSEAVLDADPH